MTASATPLVVWSEPRRASLLRVLGRAALGGVWVYVTRVVAWAPLRALLFVFAAIAFAHALVAVANLVRNRGVLLALGEDGALVWPRSIQETLLMRSADVVHGPRIAVKLEADHPGISRADPRVSLIGDADRIPFLPLHGTSVDDFIARIRVVLEPHGFIVTRQVDGMRTDDAEDDAAN